MKNFTYTTILLTVMQLLLNFPAQAQIDDLDLEVLTKLLNGYLAEQGAAVTTTIIRVNEEDLNAQMIAERTRHTNQTRAWVTLGGLGGFTFGALVLPKFFEGGWPFANGQVKPLGSKAYYEGFVDSSGRINPPARDDICVPIQPIRVPVPAAAHFGEVMDLVAQSYFKNEVTFKPRNIISGSIADDPVAGSGLPTEIKASRVIVMKQLDRARFPIPPEQAYLLDKINIKLALEALKNRIPRSLTPFSALKAVKATVIGCEIPVATYMSIKPRARLGIGAATMLAGALLSWFIDEQFFDGQEDERIITSDEMLTELHDFLTKPREDESLPKKNGEWLGYVITFGRNLKKQNETASVPIYYVEGL